MDISSIWKKRDHCIGSCVTSASRLIMGGKSDVKMSSYGTSVWDLITNGPDMKPEARLTCGNTLTRMATSNPLPTTAYRQRFGGYHSTWSSSREPDANLKKFWSDHLISHKGVMDDAKHTGSLPSNCSMSEDQRSTQFSDVMTYVTQLPASDEIQCDSGYHDSQSDEVCAAVSHVTSGPQETTPAASCSKRSRARHRKQTRKARDRQFRVCIERQQQTQAPHAGRQTNLTFVFSQSPEATPQTLHTPQSFIVTLSESDGDDSDFDEVHCDDTDDDIVFQLLPGGAHSFLCTFDILRPEQGSSSAAAGTPTPAESGAREEQPVPGDFHSVISGETEEEHRCRLLKIRAANQQWAPLPTSQRQCTVRFPAEDALHVAHAYTAEEEQAYRDARTGPWEQHARDRCRFQRRVTSLADCLGRVLQPQHREKVLRGRGQGLHADGDAR